MQVDRHVGDDPAVTQRCRPAEARSDDHASRKNRIAWVASVSQELRDRRPRDKRAARRIEPAGSRVSRDAVCDTRSFLRPRFGGAGVCSAGPASGGPEDLRFGWSRRREQSEGPAVRVQLDFACADRARGVVAVAWFRAARAAVRLGTVLAPYCRHNWGVVADETSAAERARGPSA